MGTSDSMTEDYNMVCLLSDGSTLTVTNNRKQKKTIYKHVTTKMRRLKHSNNDPHDALKYVCIEKLGKRGKSRFNRITSRIQVSDVFR